MIQKTAVATALDRNCTKSRAVLTEIQFFFNRNWIGVPGYNYTCRLVEMKLYDRRSIGKTKSVPSVSEHVHVIQRTKKKFEIKCHCIKFNIYRVSQEEWIKLRESVPSVKLYRYSPKHLYSKLNGYGDNGQRSLKL